MKLLPLVAHILVFILRCGCKLDHRHRKVKILIREDKKWWKLCITIFINCVCIPEVCQMLKMTTVNDKKNTKVIGKLHQSHFKVEIAKKGENIY